MNIKLRYKMEDKNMSEQIKAGWRLKLGVAIFLLSIVVPLAGVPMVAGLSLSAAMKVTVTGCVLIFGNILGVLAVAVMGKSGYNYIKSKFFAFLKKSGPPQKVSRSRYNIGLIIFCIPIVFAWASAYIADYLPGFSTNPLPYAVAGDLLLLVSLFVLGGEFWDKIRMLFIYNAEAHFPKK
jgi:hypothetical protein